MKNSNKAIPQLSPPVRLDSHDALIANELMLSRRLLSSLQGVAIIATDAKYNVTYANPYALNIFDLDLPQILAGTGQLPKAVQKHIALNLKNTAPEFVLQYAAGDALRTLKVFSSSCINSQGQVTGYALHMHDITDRIGTELRLRNTERLLRNLLDASPDVIFFKDEKNRWLEANKSGIELFELNSLDFQNKTDLEIAQLSDPIFKDAFKQSKLSDERAWHLEKVIRNEETIALPHGGDRVLDVIKVPLFNDDGSRQGLLTLGRDVTERKMAEIHLRDRSAILDSLISCDWLLHSSEYWQNVATRVLATFCSASNFCRAAIFINIDFADDEITNASSPTRSKLLYKWANANLGDGSQSFEIMDFYDLDLNRWKEVLQKGSPIFGDILGLPVAERKILKQYGALSIAIVPIFADKIWWGNIVVERCQSLMQATPQELGALMAIGRSIGISIVREASNKRLHQTKIAFDSATEGIMILDEHVHIIAINRGFTNITGYTELEVLNSTPASLQADKHEIWRSLSNEEKWHGEVSNFKKNGDAYQEMLTITVVKNPEGKIINYVGIFGDITESKRSQNKLHELVNHDPLTNLPNRRLLHELLEHGIKRSERDGHLIALLFVDLDRFKAINDTLGHAVGDKLICDVATRINSCMRDSDIVARLGGDEFLVMMDEIRNADDAAIAAKKIINALQGEFTIDSKGIFIGASVGISIYPNDGTDVDSLIKAADIAMYQVKNSGKNNHCFYSEDLSRHAVERYTMENQLHHALKREQLEVYYQPQVSLATGEIIGAEALIRWNHPELGLVPPDQFIPLAEETGLIIAIGEWVLRQSALQAMRWRKMGYAMQWVAVNVSGVQIMRSNFADTVYGILIETDCDPSMLELEVTESTLIQNTQYVIDTFDRIKKFNVHLAIDDFGTGYSSLSNLKKLPLDKIKIDRSFVRNLPADTGDAAIASAIHAMAESLGFTVIAEGVESLAQEAFLINMGCKEGQGYLYSKPITAANFTKFLEENQQAKA